jgi:peptidyl-prolyl cis-trans isomerase SurA
MRKQLHDEIMIQRVQQARVNFRIQVSEQEINNFLNSEEGKFWLSPEYELGHILISFSSNGRDEDLAKTEEKANAIHSQLVNGSDFRGLAVAHSGGQKALQGGDLGWRKGVELPEVFADELKDLSVGDITKPFKSGAGFHVLKIYNRKGAEETVIEQAKVRHILLKPSEILTDDEAFEQLLELREQSLNGEIEFEALAKEHSEDIGSMLSGGDLGWSLPGKFVPEFEEMLNNTDVGDISLPFRSQFGWHILKIDDRRDENMTETVVRNRAENLLRGRRFNEELEIWLQEIRSQAYVETRLPDTEEQP